MPITAIGMEDYRLEFIGKYGILTTITKDVSLSEYAITVFQDVNI